MSTSYTRRRGSGKQWKWEYIEDSENSSHKPALYVFFPYFKNKFKEGHTTGRVKVSWLRRRHIRTIFYLIIFDLILSKATDQQKKVNLKKAILQARKSKTYKQTNEYNIVPFTPILKWNENVESKFSSRKIINFSLYNFVDLVGICQWRI